jgi:hypothetical protein
MYDGRPTSRAERDLAAAQVASTVMHACCPVGTARGVDLGGRAAPEAHEREGDAESEDPADDAHRERALERADRGEDGIGLILADERMEYPPSGCAGWPVERIEPGRFVRILASIMRK